jgi:hypothetical protein
MSATPRPTERPTESIASSSASNCPQQTYAAAQREASFTFVFDSEASFTFDGASAVLTRLADVPMDEVARRARATQAVD